MRDPRDNTTGPVSEIYPKTEEIAEEMPKQARRYLKQAMESLHAPDGAVMLAASAVDAMLKAKKYKQGRLYDRIKKAAKEHIITADMEI